MFEWILRTLHDKVADRQNPVKDTHDLHVVEDDRKPVGLLGRPVVELQLERLGFLTPGAGL